jgi:hypothetical protein
MRLSSLIVTVLLFSPVLFAQHSSGGGSSSGSASSSSSSSSHSSSSSGSSSSSAHSSGGSSSIRHSSGGSDSRGSSTGSAAARSNPHFSRSGSADSIREPNKTDRETRDTAEHGKKPQPAHKGVFAFLHHRHRKPVPKGEAPPVEDEHRRRVCPPGQSPGKNGCVANPTNASTQCAPNLYGGSCPNDVYPPNSYGGSWPNSVDHCASFRGQLDPVAAELRSIKAEMQTARCSGTSPRQECSFLSQRRDAAVARYRVIQSGIPANCGTLPDPSSL